MFAGSYFQALYRNCRNLQTGWVLVVEGAAWASVLASSKSAAPLGHRDFFQCNGKAFRRLAGANELAATFEIAGPT